MIPLNPLWSTKNPKSRGNTNGPGTQMGKPSTLLGEQWLLLAIASLLFRTPTPPTRDSCAWLVHTHHLVRLCPVTPQGMLKGQDVLSRSSREMNVTLAAGKGPRAKSVALGKGRGRANKEWRARVPTELKIAILILPRPAAQLSPVSCE